jgi:carbon-monoxide dehydrogenase medium subunit
MPNIKLLQPNSIDEAVALLAAQNDDTKIISGGTALVIMLKNRLIAPATLLSLGRLAELRGIRYNRAQGCIGALVTLREAEHSALVREKPDSRRHLCQSGQRARRNAATVGGNLSEADYASDPPWCW